MSNKKTIHLVFFLAYSLLLPACNSEDINDFFSVNEITVSGRTDNLSDTAEAEVNIEGIYTSPGDPLNPSAASDTDGEFSLQLLEDDSFYLRATKAGFVATSTGMASLSEDKSGLVIKLPTETEAQNIITTAFVFAPQLVNHSWLLVDIVDAAGDEVNDQVVVLSATPAASAYLACDGSASGLAETDGAPCPADRQGPMYMAYFDTAGDVIVSIGSESQAATIKIGEFTRLEFELP